MDNFLVIDLETTTREMYGRKANPWYNQIVAVGLATETDVSAEYVYPNVLKELKINESVLVGFNMTFDLLYLWALSDLQDFFKRGGKVWDCQLAEYMLSGQQHKFPALRDIAVNKYGCPYRDKLMEPYWEAGKDTTEIPMELVIEDVTYDVTDTRAIYLQQVSESKKQGLYNLIMERMDGLLACIECEYNGMYVNQDILQTNKTKLEVQIKETEEKLQQLVGRYWLV
jgi:DNA polymerase I-like protein with 3'-5' exonuclease and polymerase domains